MSTPATLPVLIVGAGPSGLVAALSLLQNKVPVRIVDKRPKPTIGFKGNGIQPRSIELYRFLDILPDVWEHSSWFPTSRKYDHATGTHTDFNLAPFTEPSPPTPYPNYRRFDQGRHEALLRSQIAKYSSFVEFDVALETLEQHRNHVVAHLVKGNGEKETASYSYVIGADGGKGITRKLLGMPFLGDTDASRGIFGDIRIHGGLDRNYWHMWQDPQKFLGLLALCYTGYEDIFGIIMLTSSQAGESQLPTDRDSVVELFKVVTGREDIDFGELVNLQQWRPNIRMVEAFQKDRVFLAGDAAHIHSPTGGQGLNSSIQDSHNLAWKLSLCYHGLASPELLTSYTAERRPVISQMLSATTAILKATHAVIAEDNKLPTGSCTPSKEEEITPQPAVAAPQKLDSNHPRNLKGPNAVAYERGGKLLMLGINYRGSSILLDERNPATQEVGEDNDYYDSTRDGLICAGDRAPDAPELRVLSEGAGLGLGSRVAESGIEAKEGRVSLFDLFRGTRHVVLMFNAAREDVAALRSLLSSRYAQIPHMVVEILANDSSASTPEPADSDLVVLDDTKSYAHQHYAVPARTPTTIVVRPDGIIGAVVLSGASGVENYFTKLIRGK